MAMPGILTANYSQPSREGMEMTTTTQKDITLATAYRAAWEKYRVDSNDYDALIEAENDICERLNIPLEETEMGLTTKALDLIETFVSSTLSCRRSVI